MLDAVGRSRHHRMNNILLSIENAAVPALFPSMPAPIFHRPFAPRLTPGQQIRLLWLALGSAAIAELAAHSKADAVVIDMQHGLWERGSLQAAIGAVNSHMPVIVRTADGSAVSVSTALDAGAGAVLVPLIETAEAARDIVRAGRYPPIGERSAGGVRPLLHGVAGMREADRHLALGALIETTRGVDNAEAICAVDGLDFVFIGTGDLALSRGDGDSNEHKMGLAAACVRVRDAAHARGLPCGLFTLDADAARRALADGYEMVVVANDIDLTLGGFKRAVEASSESAS